MKLTIEITPDFSPFQLFKMIWHKMKSNDADVAFFESWFSSYRTVEWEEKIAQTSTAQQLKFILY